MTNMEIKLGLDKKNELPKYACIEKPKK